VVERKKERRGKDAKSGKRNRVAGQKIKTIRTNNKTGEKDEFIWRGEGKYIDRKRKREEKNKTKKGGGKGGRGDEL